MGINVAEVLSLQIILQQMSFGSVKHIYSLWVFLTATLGIIRKHKTVKLIQKCGVGHGSNVSLGWKNPLEDAFSLPSHSLRAHRRSNTPF